MVKTDQRGRLRHIPEQKQTLAYAYRAGGLTVPHYAAHHGVNYQKLVSWIKKGKQLSSAKTPSGLPYIPSLSIQIRNKRSLT